MLAIPYSPSGLLASNPAAVYLASLSVGSRPTMEQSLKSIAQMIDPQFDAFTFPWHELRYQHTTAIRTALAEKFAPATANKMLHALKGALKECKRLDLMTPVEYDKAVDFKGVPGSTALKGRVLSTEEIKKTFEFLAKNRTIKSCRDAAILHVLRTGLRRAEVVNLKVEDVDLETGAIQVMHGKGNKHRVAYLTQGGLASVSDWIKRINQYNLTTQYLFVRMSRMRKPLDEKLEAQAIWVILKWLQKELKLEELSPHDFRRTFVSDLLDRGADLVTVQKMAGHANVITTSKYDRRGENSKIQATKLLEL